MDKNFVTLASLTVHYYDSNVESDEIFNVKPIEFEQVLYVEDEPAEEENLEDDRPISLGAFCRMPPEPDG